MKKFLGMLAMVTLSMAPVLAHSASFQLGNTVYSNTKTVKIDCSQVYDASGMKLTLNTETGETLVGRMRFSIKPVVDAAWGVWTTYQLYTEVVSVEFPEMVAGTEYNIRGQFCDILGNCQTDDQSLKSVKSFKYNDGCPDGVMKIIPDFTVVQP